MHAKRACKKFMKNFLHTLCLRVIMLYIYITRAIIIERSRKCVCYTIIWIDQINGKKRCKEF